MTKRIRFLTGVSDETGIHEAGTTVESVRADEYVERGLAELVSVAPEAAAHAPAPETATHPRARTR